MIRSLQQIRRQQAGFTIVELLIVVVVIGILAALVITTYTGIQAKSRNSKRVTDLQNIQTNLESYYQTDGNYPSLANMNDTAFLNTSMKSMDTSTLQDPLGADTALGAAPAAKIYAYQPLNSSGSSCEADATTCVSYTLTATMESGAPTLVKKNLD
jgi:prepilin-type N-terminal cleavage/methylation domain-containing protein